MNENNKGRKGELMVLGVLNDASMALGDIEPLRHTCTNTPDMGIDITLVGARSSIDIIINIGEGEAANPLQTGAIESFDKTRAKARVDVKNYGGKITTAAMNKFIQEISILPEFDYHIMAGSNGMMAGAKRSFENARKVLNQTGKFIHYIDNTGIYKISQAFPPIRPTNPNELQQETSCQQNTED